MGRLSAALIAFAAMAGLAGCGSDAASPAPDAQPSEAGAGPILSGELPLLNGEPADLERYRGAWSSAARPGPAPGASPWARLADSVLREDVIVHSGRA